MANIPTVYPQPTSPTAELPASGATGLGLIGPNDASSVDPDKLNANIAREDYNDYITRYVPYEDKLIGQLQNPNFYDADISRAGERAAQSNVTAEASSERDLGRYGISLTPEQRRAIDKVRKLGASANVAGSLNTARDQFADIRLQGLSFLADAGRQQAASAAGLTSDLALKKAQRDAANRTAGGGASAAGGALSGAASGAAIGAAFGGVGAPVGAAIGGVLGLVGL